MKYIPRKRRSSSSSPSYPNLISFLLYPHCRRSPVAKGHNRDLPPKFSSTLDVGLATKKGSSSSTVTALIYHSAELVSDSEPDDCNEHFHQHHQTFTTIAQWSLRYNPVSMRLIYVTKFMDTTMPLFFSLFFPVNKTVIHYTHACTTSSTGMVRRAHPCSHSQQSMWMLCQPKLPHARVSSNTWYGVPAQPGLE